MLKLRLVAAAAAALILSAAGAAQATSLVFDDFESYGPTSQLNFTGFTSGLIVTDGTVDYVHEPEFGLSTPYGEGLVDLDGTSNDAGILTTALFNITAGQDVLLEFDASGNQRGGSDTTFQWGFKTPGGLSYTNVFYDVGGGPVSVQPAFSTGYSVYYSTYVSNAPWQHIRFGFTAGSSGALRPFLSVDGGDNVGPLIDNFSLSATGGVPEPATWGLMIAGFGLAGGALRRRRPVAA